MTDPFSESPDEFLGTARAALRSTTDNDSLETLGWIELLAYLDDRDARHAAFALFQAQGHELITTSALGYVMAVPYLHAFSEAGPIGVAMERSSERRGRRTVVLGGPIEGPLLIDRVGRGAGIIEVSAADFRPVDLPGRLGLHELEVEIPDEAIFIPEVTAVSLRRRSYFRGRIALAFEMLGAAEAALGLATAYAAYREQFGQPIGRFQAVRHLLAWARVDSAAIEAVSFQAANLDGSLPPRYDEVVKAVAGRNARRVCQRTLQVLGGIGFTAEHPHHHFYSRVLGLDALLGSSVTLAHELALDWRNGLVPLPTLTMPMLMQAG